MVRIKLLGKLVFFINTISKSTYNADKKYLFIDFLLSFGGANRILADMMVFPAPKFRNTDHDHVIEMRGRHSFEVHLRFIGVFQLVQLVTNSLSLYSLSKKSELRKSEDEDCGKHCVRSRKCW